VNLVAIDDKDAFCKAVSEISHYFCQRTIETDIKDLSLLTLELINGKHDFVQSPDSQGQQGTHFNPAIHQRKTREQYLGVLTRLALFLVRGCVIGDGSEDEYGIPLVFTPGQQLAANKFHEAVAAYVDKEPDAEDHAADALYDLALSVWFAPVDAIDSSSWSNAWRRFFSICSLSPKDRNIIPPNRIAIWLSELKFCMRLVACHKIRSDWVTQKDSDNAARVDESVIVISCRALGPILTPLVRICRPWLSLWFSQAKPSPYQEMRSFAAKAAKFSANADPKNEVSWAGV
jgi:hypothetical protein